MININLDITDLRKQTLFICIDIQTVSLLPRLLVLIFVSEVVLDLICALIQFLLTSPIFLFLNMVP